MGWEADRQVSISFATEGAFHYTGATRDRLKVYRPPQLRSPVIQKQAVNPECIENGFKGGDLSSPSIIRLQHRLEDARRLVEIHRECTGDRQGRRRGYDALNRSAVVLSVAAWEGFIEEALEGAVATISRRALGPSTLPENVRNAMLAHLHELHGWDRLSAKSKSTIWALAGRGWRREYIEYARSRISSLNTPNPGNVQKLCAAVIGLSGLSSNWTSKRLDEGAYISRMNDLLTLRHRIAHGAIDNETVGKAKSKAAIALVEHVAQCCDTALQHHVHSLKLRPPRTQQTQE